MSADHSIVHTQDHHADPEHIRLGRDFKALCQNYGLKEATITVRPHTEGEDLTYRWFKAGPSAWSSSDGFSCTRKSISTENL